MEIVQTKDFLHLSRDLRKELRGYCVTTIHIKSYILNENVMNKLKKA